VAFSEDHNAITNALAIMRSGNNPDGRERTGGALEMPNDIWQKMMSGKISPLEARTEWAAIEPGQRRFNDRLRAEAGLGGMVADAEQALDPEGRPVIRDASSGQYVDLSAEARAATGLQETGGITPTEHLRDGDAPDANQGIRAAYEAMVARRQA